MCIKYVQLMLVDFMMDRCVFQEGKQTSSSGFNGALTQLGGNAKRARENKCSTGLQASF
jgi:hypothetical protein